MTTLPIVRPSSEVSGKSRRFDAVVIACHWLTLLLVLGLFGSALAIGQSQDEPAAEALLGWHRSLGVIVWAVTLVRLLWRWTHAPAPPLPQSTSAAQRLAARLNEYALYALLVLQPATGLAQTLFRGHPFVLFGLSPVPALLARNKELTHLFHGAHEWGAWAFAGLIGLHAAAALFHRFVLRDGVFERMWIARSSR